MLDPISWGLMGRSPVTEEHARRWAGSLVQEARILSGMSQRELAAAAGVPQSRISRIESFQEQPSYPVLSRILYGAGLELRTRLAPYDDHDDVLWERDQQRTPQERAARDAGLDRFLALCEVQAQ